MSSVWFYEPFYDFDRLVDNFFSSPAGASSGPLTRRNENVNVDGAVRSIRPRMDLHENKENNTVTASFELPGFKKEDVQIELHNGRLSVSAENSISKEKEESGYAVRERRYGKFSRTLQLPEGIKESEVKAAMENGILTVTFPKSSPELAPKRITVA